LEQIAGIVAEMMTGQPISEVHPKERTTEEARKRDCGDCERTHDVL
jgi:hypothetical protein